MSLAEGPPDLPYPKLPFRDTVGLAYSTYLTAMSTIFTVYYLLIVPIGIGFLSHAYRHFFQAPLQLPE